ncbi:MAG: hypothetical protein WDN69_26565 [Aliidongia sp.]
MPSIQGGRERGLLLHKLLEEILTGETAEVSIGALQARAAELLGQIGLADSNDPARGPSSAELAACALRGVQISEIAALRPQLRAEVPVYGSMIDGTTTELTSGIADAVAVGDDGRIRAVIDWKSDVDPDPVLVGLYRQQIRDYVDVTGAGKGLLVFLTSGRIETVQPSPMINDRTGVI